MKYHITKTTKTRKLLETTLQTIIAGAVIFLLCSSGSLIDLLFK